MRSQRLRQVKDLICEGMSNKEIAERMGLTEGSVKIYVSKVLSFTGYTDRLKMATSVLWAKIRALEIENQALRSGRAA